MPASRVAVLPNSRSPALPKPYTKLTLYEPSTPTLKPNTSSKLDKDALAASLGFSPPPAYPLTPSARAAFRTGAGKGVSSHAWAVYDFLLTIPEGRVSTYAELARAINSSPRAVGGALRSNPFAPTVPCHRIIASTLFVGGFQGEWNGSRGEGVKQNRKLRLLESEGVRFDGRGFLVGGEVGVWKRE